MSDTLKTIAEFMGWEYEEIETVTDMGNLALIFPDNVGPAVVKLSRDDLQLVIEKFTPDQHARYWELKVKIAIDVAPYPSEGIEATWQSMDLLPTQTLADICAAVIGETK